MSPLPPLDVDTVLKECPQLLRWIARPRLLFRGFVRLANNDAWAGRALLIFLTVALLALPFMGELQATLRGMHPPGWSSYDAGDPANFGFQLPSTGHAADVLNTWERARVEAADLDVSSPKEIFRAFFVIDLAAFAPMYCAALLLGLLMLRRRSPPPENKTTANGKAEETPTPETEVSARRRLLAGAVATVPALFVLDEIENFSALALSARMGRFVEQSDLSLALITTFWLASWLKWIVAALIIVPALIAIVSLLRGSAKDRRSDTWATLMAIRLHLLLLVFFGAIVLFAEQGSDVLRAWNGAWWQAAAGVGFTLMLAFVVASTARYLLLVTPVVGRNTPPRGLLAIGLTLIAVGFALDKWLERAEGVWTLGAIIAAIGLLSWPIASVVPRMERPLRQRGPMLPTALGVAAVALLGFAILKASVNDVFYGRDWEGSLVLMVIGIVVVASASTYYVVVGGRLNVLRAPLAAAAVVAAGLTIAVWVAPWETGFRLGTIAVLSGWMIAVLLGWTALVRGLGKRQTPPALTIVGLTRIPVLTLILLWAWLAAAMDDGGYHNVRSREAAERDPLTLEQVFDRWVRDHGLEQPAPESSAVHGKKTGIPLVFVSASGGGVRAAFWTAIALDCLLEAAGCESSVAPGDLAAPAVFLASGISGGSLGLTTFAASRVQGSGLTPGEDPVRDRFDSDQLAPATAWALFADLPNSLLRFDLLRDRAAVLEEAWERGWPDWNGDKPTGLSLGLFQLRDLEDDEGRHLPLLLLNGTSVEDGCRFNSSFLDAAIEARQAGRLVEECIALRPFESGSSEVSAERRKDWVLAATKDINEFLCNEEGKSAKDVRLSTAALLSARFPYVSPAGRVVKCNEPGGESATYVVDGGYFDTSGASPIVEAWQALEPWVASFNLRSPDSCLVPVYVQLDNGYDNPRGPHPNARPQELLVPLQAVTAARNAREANARQAGALAFAQQLFKDDDGEPYWDLNIGMRFRLASGGPLVRYAHIYPRAHPGSRAPLGWSLSKSAMGDLEQQLAGKGNEAQVERVHQWLEKDALSCEISES